MAYETSSIYDHLCGNVCNRIARKAVAATLGTYKQQNVPPTHLGASPTRRPFNNRTSPANPGAHLDAAWTGTVIR
jgi:hypothetical protein